MKWSPGETGTLTDIVEFYIAVDISDTVAHEQFDYEVNNKDFDWVKIGEAAMADGEAFLEIPSLGLAPGEIANVNVMARASEFTGSESEQCSFFDLSTNVTLVGSEPVTSSPTITVTEPPVGAPAAEQEKLATVLIILAIAVLVLSVLTFFTCLLYF